MNVANAYSAWAARYDSDSNLTRDLDGQVTREVIGTGPFPIVVEAGCGTGKNTGYLSEVAGKVLALDFSTGMLEIARRKVQASNVDFREADYLGAAHACGLQLVRFDEWWHPQDRKDGVPRLATFVFAAPAPGTAA